MNLDTSMAWRNVWRNPRRTFLTVAAIAFACLLLVFMLSFQFGSYYQMIQAAVGAHTGHLQIQAQGYLDKRDMRLVVAEPGAVGRMLDGIPEVKAYSFRANAFSLASSRDRTYGAMVVGMDPKREPLVSTLPGMVRIGRFLEPGEKDAAVVGRLLAKNLKVEPGSELTLLGQGREGGIAATVVKVVGIYSTGQDEFDRSSLLIPLADFQDVYNMDGAVHEVVITGESLEHLDMLEKEVSRDLASIANPKPLVALTWDEIMPGLKQGIQMDLVSGLIFYFLLILVVAFSIMNTFLMAVLERTREFGVMMAMGVTPGRLVKLLLLESTAMTLVGVAAGLVLGGALTLYFQSVGILFDGADQVLAEYGISGRMYPRLSLLSVSIGPAAVLIITFLASLYPALKVRSLKPVEAMNAA